MTAQSLPRDRPPREWSLSALCDQLGMARRTLMKRMAGVPYRWDAKANTKLYTLDVVMKALIAAETKGPIADIDESKARKANAEATMAEIAMFKQRGEVVELAVVTDMLSREYASVRTKLLSLPSRLAPLLDAADGIDAKRKVLSNAVEEILTELTNADDLSFETMVGPAGDEGEERVSA